MSTKEQKIRITFTAYDYSLLELAVKAVLEVAKKSGASTSGPVPLPVEIQKHTLLISPHVNKKARDQLEIRTHKRLLDINDVTKSTVDSLMNLDLAAGVNIEIKL